MAKSSLDCAIEEFTFEEREAHTLQDFIDIFRYDLPVVVCVAEGFLSPDADKFTFSGGDVYWISHIKKQQRIIGRNAEGLNFSIPFDHKIKFRVYEDGCDPWNPSSLENILFLVKDTYKQRTIHLDPTNTHTVTAWQGVGNVNAMPLTTLQLIDTYTETYLVASPMFHGVLHDHQNAIPVFVPITLIVANGLSNNDNETAFQSEMTKLKANTALFPNKDAPGNPEIMIFTDSQIEEFGGAYEYVNPYGTIANIARKKPGIPGNDKAHPNNKPTTEEPPIIPHRPPSIRQPGKIPAPLPESKTKNTARPHPKSHIMDGGLTKVVAEIQLQRKAKVEPADQLHRESVVSIDSGVCMRESDNLYFTSKMAAIESDEDDYEYPDEPVYAEINDVPKNIDIKSLSVADICRFLRLLKLKKYIDTFREEGVDGSLLCDLSIQDLKTGFGFSGIEAKKLFKFIHEGWRPKLK